MTNEISVDRLITFLPRRAYGETRIISGPLKGLAGRAFELGRDGRLLLQTPPPQQSEHFVVLDLDWLDTDLVSRMVRTAYRTRRVVLQAPQRALTIWSCILPERVVAEDLGDYIECLHNACDEGNYVSVYVTAGRAMYWTTVNAVRMLVTRV